MKRKILITCLLITFIINIILIKSGIISTFDTNISIIFSNYITDNLTTLMKIISFICSPISMILINIILFIIFIIRKKQENFIITISSIISVIFNNIIKIIIRRERPNIINLVYESTYSFPSGHAMISILFFGSIIYLINKNNNKYRKLITCLLSTFILLVGISRIYLGAHFFTDVLSGYILSISLLLIIISIYERLL